MATAVEAGSAEASAPLLDDRRSRVSVQASRSAGRAHPRACGPAAVHRGYPGALEILRSSSLQHVTGSRSRVIDNPNRSIDCLNVETVRKRHGDWVRQLRSHPQRHDPASMARPPTGAMVVEGQPWRSLEDRRVETGNRKARGEATDVGKTRRILRPTSVSGRFGK